MEDGLSTFLARAGELPLLTADEEKRLARTARGGPPCRVGGRPFRTPEEARNELVERNVRLAVSKAARWQGNGVPLDDLVQEAVLGLHAAAGRFDPDKGYKFSTYATRWIDRNLWNAAHTTGPQIKRSDEVAMRIARIRKARRDRPRATAAELAAAARCTEAEVAEAIALDRPMAELDAPAGEEHRSLHDTVAAPGELGVIAAAAASDPDIAGALASMPEGERRALELRAGLDGRARTPAETAQELGVTRREADRLWDQAQARLHAALDWKFGTVECERDEPVGSRA